MGKATEYNNNGLHVFVFCCADYKDLVGKCIKSIEQYVKDPILSRNIISNIQIDVGGYNLIEDLTFWKLLDPEFRFKNIYNNNSVKQQLFKLNLNKLVNGNVLLVDANARFTEEVKWVEDSKYNIYYTHSHINTDSSEFVRAAIKLEKDYTKSYITNAMVMSTDILEEIQNLVTTIHNTDQLSSYQQMIFDVPSKLDPALKFFVSEYDLYATYLKYYHSDKISKELSYPTVGPHYTVKREIDGSQTAWITFYTQIKDPLWPECETEADFVNLPAHIQEECINIFGYQPGPLQ